MTMDREAVAWQGSSVVIQGDEEKEKEGSRRFFYVTEYNLVENKIINTCINDERGMKTHR